MLPFFLNLYPLLHHLYTNKKAGYAAHNSFGSPAMLQQTQHPLLSAPLSREVRFYRDYALIIIVLFHLSLTLLNYSLDKNQ